ncbi:hypothetical protein BDQ12DRAFT_262189 [Crucibulum laeve]|uniref:Uncharacterized protein n=1 Tax=Crucibulum laeve TaxID=68775 RepID=A0A5C3LS76_9AGAR|nr:hypothetical protein BDQ12DRAFT_262189 [Crucibulum laeve]
MYACFSRSLSPLLKYSILLSLIYAAISDSSIVKLVQSISSTRVSTQPPSALNLPRFMRLSMSLLASMQASSTS